MDTNDSSAARFMRLIAPHYDKLHKRGQARIAQTLTSGRLAKQIDLEAVLEDLASYCVLRCYDARVKRDAEAGGDAGRMETYKDALTFYLNRCEAEAGRYLDKQLNRDGFRDSEKSMNSIIQLSHVDVHVVMPFVEAAPVDDTKEAEEQLTIEMMDWVQERFGLRTRGILQNAALEGATINDLCAQFGISKRRVLHVLKTAKDALREAFAGRYRQLREE